MKLVLAEQCRSTWDQSEQTSGEVGQHVTRTASRHDVDIPHKGHWAEEERQQVLLGCTTLGFSCVYLFLISFILLLPLFEFPCLNFEPRTE